MQKDTRKEAKEMLGPSTRGLEVQEAAEHQTSGQNPCSGVSLDEFAVGTAWRKQGAKLRYRANTISDIKYDMI